MLQTGPVAILNIHLLNNQSSLPMLSSRHSYVLFTGSEAAFSRSNTLNQVQIKSRQRGANSGNQVDGICNHLVFPYAEIVEDDAKTMCSMP